MSARHIDCAGQRADADRLRPREAAQELAGIVPDALTPRYNPDTKPHRCWYRGTGLPVSRHAGPAASSCGLAWRRTGAGFRRWSYPLPLAAVIAAKAQIDVRARCDFRRGAGEPAARIILCCSEVTHMKEQPAALRVPANGSVCSSCPECSIAAVERLPTVLTYSPPLWLG